MNRPTFDTPSYSRTIPIEDDTKQYRSTWNSSIVSEPNQRSSIIEEDPILENNKQDNRPASSSSSSSSSSSDEPPNQKQENPAHDTFSEDEN